MEDFLHNLDWVLPLRNGFLTPVFEFFTYLGYPDFFFFSLPILYWVWKKESANRVTLALLSSALLTYYFKNLFQDPRPTPYFMEGHEPDSFGLPSGHTQLSIVFWFSLALEIGKRWFWGIALFFACGIAFSRLYLGVHDVEDVIGGIVLGTVGLLLLRWLFTKPPVFQCSIIITLLGLVLLLWQHGTVSGKVIALGGFITGWLSGMLLENRYLNFERGRIWQKIISVGLGLVGVAGLLKILTLFFTAIRFPEPPAQYIGGLLIGLLITFLAPLFFRKIGLMRSNQPG